MRTQHDARLSDAQPSGEQCGSPAFDPSASTLILDGYTAKLTVADGQLQAEDSTNGQTRSVTFTRGTCKLSRIIIHAKTGAISLTALRWIQALGIHLAMLEGEGSSLQVSLQTNLSRVNDTRLRRAQALALDAPVGVEVTRRLLSAKVQGQRANLARLGYEPPMLSRLCERLEQAETIDACRSIESQMAKAYWECWSVLDCQWASKDETRIPEHWRSAGQRTSVKSKSPRRAITPVNAILNYCYKLAEVETVIALHAVGLDPSFGIVHTDHPYRNSMALDLLEAIRPEIDSRILDLIERRTFTRQDFTELPSGECQLSPSLRSELGAMMPLWREAIAPVAEWVANTLRPANRVGRKEAPTPLTNLNKQRAQATIKASRSMRKAG